MSSAESWKLEGDCHEGCDCKTVRPCVYLGPPDEGSFHVTIVWHVEKGHHGDTKLDGLNVVATFRSPGHMVTGPKWSAALFLVSRAKSPRAEAFGISSPDGRLPRDLRGGGGLEALLRLLRDRGHPRLRGSRLCQPDADDAVTPSKPAPGRRITR